MFQVESLGGGQPRTPPAEPPVQTYTVQAGDSVESVASSRGITAEELARHNGITADATLKPGSELALPANAVRPAATPGDDKPQTPAEKTDAAIGKYHDVVAKRDKAVQDAPQNQWMRTDVSRSYDGKLKAARSAMDKAIKSEIDGVVAARRHGVPVQYQAPKGKLADAAGKDILARQPKGSSTTKDAVKQSITDHSSDIKAKTLIPADNRDVSAADKLHNINLDGQPKAVVDKVMHDPRVQSWVKQTAAEVAKPYEGVDDDRLDVALEPSGKAAKKLADITSGLNPDLAAAVARESLPTLQKMGKLDPRYADAPFGSLSQVVDNMKEADDATGITSDIASAIKSNAGDHLEGYKSRGGSSPISKAVGDGHSPALAIELARQLKADGHGDTAVLLDDIIEGAKMLRTHAAGDLTAYARKTETLSWLIKNAGAGMTAKQLKKAVADYQHHQDDSWKAGVNKAESKVVADGRALAEVMKQMENLPPDLCDASTSGKLDTLHREVGDDTYARQVMQFAIKENPSIMQGEDGRSVLDFFGAAGRNGRDFNRFMGSLVQSYVSQNVISKMQNVDPNHPQTIEDAKQALTNLETQWKQGHWTDMLGVKDKKLETVIKKTEESFPKSGESSRDVVRKLEQLDESLGHVKGFSRDTAAGKIFRGLSFAANAAGFANAMTHKPENVEDAVGDMALALGLAHDSAAFVDSLAKMDENGSLSRWANGTSTTGKLTGKLLGWVGVGLATDGAVRSFADGDVPAGLLNAGMAGGGAAAMILADTAWGGPVGLAIGVTSALALGWYQHVQSANKHENDPDTARFLRIAADDGTGFSPDTARALSDESGQGYSPVPLLVKYAQDKGYNLNQAADRHTFYQWINGMSGEQLSQVRDELHHTLDEFGGDVDKLGKDATKVWPEKTVPTKGAPASIHDTPRTVGALDAMMSYYGADPLPMAWYRVSVSGPTSGGAAR